MPAVVPAIIEERVEKLGTIFILLVYIIATGVAFVVLVRWKKDTWLFAPLTRSKNKFSSSIFMSTYRYQRNFFSGNC
jgi:hypothetical protein